MNDLRWYQWLTWTARQILEADCDPNERFDRIGHRRPLSARWALSIGMWGLRTPTEIMRAVGIDPNTTARGTFDVFKYRHRLYSGAQMSRELATLPKVEDREFPYPVWDQYRLANIIYMRAQCRMVEKDTPFNGDIIEMLRRQLGILPVEAYLYYYAINNIIEDLGISQISWVRLTPVERREAWDSVMDGSPMVIECPEEVRSVARKQGFGNEDTLVL